MMKKSTVLLLAVSALIFCPGNKAQAQCSVNAGSDITLYTGYPPQSCATLTATPSGTAPFSYLWSNGSTAASITVCDQTPTVYSVTVTDASGCVATDAVNVNVVNVSCGKNNGKKVLICHTPKGNVSNAHTICVSINAVAAHLAHGDKLGDCSPPPAPCSVNLGNDAAICAGDSLVLDAGAGFSSYLWSDNSTGQTLTVTVGGTYWVSITNATGCTASDTIQVLVHNAPVISLVADSLPDSLGCRNITATISSGTPPVTLLWSTGDSTASIHVCDTGTTTYTVTATDSNGCTASASITIGPSVTCSVNLGSDTTLCIDSSYILDAGPGFSSYLWSDSSTSQTLSVTQSGSYWVQVSNAATGCAASDTILLTLNQAPQIILLADSVPDSLGCRNITATISSGTPPYALLWGTGDTTTTINVCDTLPTTYVLTVTDSNGCSVTDSITVGPALICAVNLGSDTTLCAYGSIVLDAGAGFDTYLWSDSSTAQTLSVTASGTYWVQVTDSATSCTASDTVALTLIPAPVINVVADSLPDSLGCRNITVLVTSGAPPFTYAWSTGASTASIHVCDTVATTYTVTVTVANGCSATDSVHLNFPCLVNLGPDTSFCDGATYVLDAGPGFMTYLWSDSSTARTLTVTQSGTYWVQASDTSAGCLASDTVVITVNPLPVVAFVLDTIPDSLGCRDLTVMVSGGTAPYSIQWNTGDSTATISVCDTVNTLYTVTVTDSIGCPVTDSILVTKLFSCFVELGDDTSFCSGGTLLLDASAGFLTYLWSDSSTAQTLSVTQSGTYWVQVTDTAINCIASDTIEVTVFPSPEITLVADSLVDSLGCRNIMAVISAGTPPFVYSWSNGDSLSTIHVCDTIITTYTVMVTDSNGCMAMDSITVIPAVFCAVNLGSDTSFCSASPMVLDAGAGFHSYLWSDSSTAQTLMVTGSGTYWVQVSDSNTGCLASDTIELVMFDSPIATAVADTVPDSLGCFNITGSVTGGTPPYTYAWSNGDTTLVINVCDTLPTAYIFTVTDSNGCMAMDTATVNDTASRPAIAQRSGTLLVYPNPILDNARISFALPESGTVRIELFDIQGTLLRNLYVGRVQENTTNSIDFNGGSLLEGVYMIRLTRQNGQTLNQKIILFKY